MKRKPQGWYAESAEAAPVRPCFAERRTADIGIIGAGYTGLCAALHAAETGARVIVLEAERVGFGASGRNGGQIHTGLRKEQRELERWLGAAHARDLWSLSEEAKALVRSLIARHAIACNLKSGLIIAAHNRRATDELARETTHLATRYGYCEARMLNAEETAKAIGSAIYHGCRLDSGGGHLHPLSYARGLAAAAERAGAEIFEQSRVVAIEQTNSGVELQCQGGSVFAGKAILAIDAFSSALVPELACYIGHIESFVTATAPLSEMLRDQILPGDEAVADTRHVLDYYRKSAEGRMLFAGREAYFGMPKDIARLVRPRMLRVFPQLCDIPTEYAWSGTVGITVTRMPHFGRVGERLVFAHGYSGQGVSLATLGGRLLAEATLGHQERFDVFARVPARAFPGGQTLRKPLLAAGLFAFKLADAL
ncbi:MAG TPA: FAD-binding oxidoreductase [Rhizomicrobium sp.]|jgi:gamma-glutamylputrescine oxidase|nr:FAD-binding oxidoreductase [Rhizomicrobium sp.]